MSTAGMTPVGRADDLRRQRLTAFAIGDESIVIVALETGFRAVVNRCPHQQAQIFHQGSVDDGALTCPLHGRTYDLSTGVCRNGAGRITFVPTALAEGILWAGPVPAPDFSAF